MAVLIRDSSKSCNVIIDIKSWQLFINIQGRVILTERKLSILMKTFSQYYN